MKTFYLVRKEDVHGVSGTGVVAEGAVFDNGMVAMTWLSEYPTVTMFPSVKIVIKIHGHEGRTVMVMEGRKRDAKQFEACKGAVRASKSEARKGEGSNV